MALLEYLMGTEPSDVPLDSQEISMSQTRGAKENVAYENAGQTPPNTGKTLRHNYRAVIEVWAFIVMGMLFAFWLFWKSVSHEHEAEPSAQEETTSGTEGTVAGAVGTVAAATA